MRAGKYFTKGTSAATPEAPLPQVSQDEIETSNPVFKKIVKQLTICTIYIHQTLPVFPSDRYPIKYYGVHHPKYTPEHLSFYSTYTQATSAFYAELIGSLHCLSYSYTRWATLRIFQITITVACLSAAPILEMRASSYCQRVKTRRHRSFICCSSWSILESVY